MSDKNIYFYKYCLYKKKYLKLKEKLQNGGAAPLPEKNRINFTIYTTGISNWLNSRESENSNQNIARIYNNLKGNIINQIPLRYNISIKHYDPLIGGHIDTSNNNYKNRFDKLCENLNYIGNNEYFCAGFNRKIMNGS